MAPSTAFTSLRLTPALTISTIATNGRLESHIDTAHMELLDAAGFTLDADGPRDDVGIHLHAMVIERSY
jgi:hypothetical protein